MRYVLSLFAPLSPCLDTSGDVQQHRVRGTFVEHITN